MDPDLPRELWVAILKRTDMDTRRGLGIRPGRLQKLPDIRLAVPYTTNLSKIFTQTSVDGSRYSYVYDDFHDSKRLMLLRREKGCTFAVLYAESLSQNGE